MTTKKEILSFVKGWMDKTKYQDFLLTSISHHNSKLKVIIQPHMEKKSAQELIEEVKE